MNILSISPLLRTASLIFRPREKAWALTVVAKATFDLCPGKVTLAATPEEIHPRDVHFGQDPTASVYAPGDLAPLKPQADVVLVGSAFAAEGKAVRSLVTRLCTAGIDKSIEVFCKRIWTRDDRLREGGHWVQMPLRYERAAGGLDTWNPVGIRSDAPADRFGQRAAPNLQRPGLTVEHRTDLLPPAGFGPIAASWLLRRERLGSRAETWSDDALGTMPLGDDFDTAYFQMAPPDQQVDALRDDEAIVLEHLHPEHARLETALSGARPRAFLERQGSAPAQVELRADTLWIDTERALCTVTWRGQVPLQRPHETGRIVLVLEEPGECLTWNDVAARADGEVPETAAEEPGLLDVGSGTASMPAPGGSSDWRRSPGRETTTTLVIRSETQLDSVPNWVARAVGKSPAPAPVNVPPLVHTGVATSATGDSTITDAAELAPSLGMPAWLAAKGAMPPPVPVSPPAMPALVPGAVPEPHLLFAAYAGRTTLDPPGPPEPAWSPPAAPPPPPAPKPRPPAAESEPPWVDLIWFDPSYVPRIHKNTSWAAHMNKALPAPSEEAAKAAESKAHIVRTALTNVLSKSTPGSANEIYEALADTFPGESAALPPLLLLAGELDISFDEMETLTILASASAPLGATDKRLGKVLGLVDEMMKTPFRGAPDVVDGFVHQVREAWAAANRSLPASFLDTHTERLLLEQRHYRKRELLDETWIRAQLAVHGFDPPPPAYLPATLAKRLPLFKRFAARLLVEVLPQQDQYEASPIALRVVALGRVLDRLSPGAKR